MWSRTLPIAAFLALAAPASAEGFRVIGPASPAAGGAYGYADEFVRGAHVGAPLTRFPRPTQIVPAPWSYGTYGIPTVSGITEAPAAQPTLTVINARAPGDRGRPAGVQVIEVQVPHR